MKAKVFFLWGSLCTVAFVYANLLIFETKGLSLEQVDRMFEETTAPKSSKWVPHSTFAADMGLLNAEKKYTTAPGSQNVEDIGKPGGEGAVREPQRSLREV